MTTYRKSLLALVWLLGIMCLSFRTPAFAQDPMTKQNGPESIQLGSIEVQGRAMVLRVLEIIKQGLNEPYSNDPKLANVVVCRLNDVTGSHVKKTLLCATNRALSGGREALQLGAVNARASETNGMCETSTCMTREYEQWSAALNEALDRLPGHYLHATVEDGAAFRKLLRSIPNPKMPPSTTNAAAASTHS